MKKTAIVFVFIAFSINAMCQGTFTEKTFNDLMAQFAKDPVAMFKTDAAENFVFIDGNGKRKSKNEVMNSYAMLNETRQVSDLKINQSNQTAVVTGLVEQTLSVKNAPTQFSKYKGMFTYVFAYQQNKWMLMSSQHADYQPSKEDDEAAIKKVIQDETDGYYEGNATKNLNQWSGKANDEYQRQMLTSYIGNSYAKGESMARLKEIMQKNAKKQEANITNTDFEIRLRGNMAWVTYTQEIKQGEKTLQKARETRILERINNDWKIVFVSGQDAK